MGESECEPLRKSLFQPADKKKHTHFFFFVNSAKPKYAYSAMDPGYTEKNPLDLAYILNRFKRFEYRINQLGFCAYIEPI